MTRINLIEPIEISDQHLLAEYRELPRIVNAVVNQKVLLKNIPDSYCLGQGHVKFFYDKLIFLALRYGKIYDELLFRGFSLNPQYCSQNMMKKIRTSNYRGDASFEIRESDVELSRERLVRKYRENPALYRWTKRIKPDYYNE